MYVTVEEARNYCNQTHTDDDWLFALLIDAAEAESVNFLNHALSEHVTSDSSPPDLDGVLKPNVKVGLLQLIATLYENREKIVTGTIVSKIDLAEQMMHFERTGLGV